MTHRLPVAAIALLLAACSSDPGSNAVNENAAESPVNAAAAPVANESAPPPATPPVPSATTLTLEGLGPLRIGAPVPKDSGWGEHGAQASDTCRIVTSPATPGVYAIVEEGRVRRISVGQRAPGIRLVEGIGVGSSEKEALAAFPGFRSQPHEYVDAPAKYLTAPNAESGDPALRFEIGADGKVAQVHVGTMPVLGYVEACS